MLAYPRTFAFVALVALFEIFHVSVRSEQIANAMLLIIILSVMFLSHIYIIISSLQNYTLFFNLQNYSERVAKR